MLQHDGAARGATVCVALVVGIDKEAGVARLPVAVAAHDNNVLSLTGNAGLVYNDRAPLPRHEAQGVEALSNPVDLQRQLGELVECDGAQSSAE